MCASRWPTGHTSGDVPARAAACRQSGVAGREGARGRGAVRARRLVAGCPVGADQLVAAVGVWSIVHGFASLWLNGAVPAALGVDPERARAVAALLFRAP